MFFAGRRLAALGFGVGLPLLSACTGFSVSTSGAYVFSLKDDTLSNLLWSSQENLRGNQLGLTLSGDCGEGLEGVQIEIASAEANYVFSGEVLCVNGGFNVTLPSAAGMPAWMHFDMSFQARAYGVLLEEVPAVKRGYDYYSADATTFVTVDNPAAASSSVTTPSIMVQGHCAQSPQILSSVKITIASHTPFACPLSGAFSENLDLNSGTNTFDVSWTDEYGNRGSKAFQVTLNAPGAPTLVAAGLSFVPAGSIAHVSGGSASSPVIFRVSAGTTRNTASLLAGTALETLSPGLLSPYYQLCRVGGLPHIRLSDCGYPE